MAEASKYKALLSKVHQGVPFEKAVPQAEEEKTFESETKSVTSMEPVETSVAPATNPNEPPSKPTEKRKRKPQPDYQSLFFNRIDFTHRKPLYITATTHRRLMRIVHLMDESKATISSYVENIILNHLETFKEEIDIIYQTNNLNPTE